MLPADPGRELVRYFAERYGKDPFIEVADISSVKEGRVVVCAANAAEPFLMAHHFSDSAIVCDIAVPHNVDPRIRSERPDVLYMHGGIVATPNGESLDPGARAFLDSGQL